MFTQLEITCWYNQNFNNGILSFRYEGARLWNLLDPRFKEGNSVADIRHENLASG